MIYLGKLHFFRYWTQVLNFIYNNFELSYQNIKINYRNDLYTRACNKSDIRK